MANFRELAAFAQFGSDVDKSTQDQLDRGKRLQEILKQPQYEPVSLENQVIGIFAGTKGYADKIPLERMKEWELTLMRFMSISYPKIGKAIAEQKRLTPALEAQLHEALTAFMATWL